MRYTNPHIYSTQMEDNDPHQSQAPWPPRSKVKVARSSQVISLSRVSPVVHKSKTNSRSITKIGRRVPHDTCYIMHQFQGQKVKDQGHRPTNADTQNVPKKGLRTSKSVCEWRTYRPASAASTIFPRYRSTSRGDIVSTSHASLPLLNSGNKILHLCP